ncbi:hypothetical protein Q4508_18215 [Amphritea sp. 2_MG-2023]|uniref:hypothetical protein n=1 Tax=Amphritea TaxID=515417 RepID=UPI001C06AAD4|nr:MULTISPECIES: hypothetical protein [Amphritea]MBU2966914.1 hypothetical protein [Amphritea atlantica]MDO6420492.1 hypothetical protein [Amphritea sp. 2_MG-2023]
MNIFKMLLSITLLVPTLVFAQGGDTPVEGIDIIIKAAGLSGKVELNEGQLKRVSALKDEVRSYYLSEVIPPMLNKAMGGKYNEKELQNILLKQLLANRCNPCKAFETFSYKAKDSRTKETYSVTFNLHTQVDIAKPQHKVAEVSASRELKVKAVPDAIKPK